MGCHTWDPSKSHGHIFAGPTWAATPGAQKDAHMKPSWVPQAHADWEVCHLVSRSRYYSTVNPKVMEEPNSKS